MSFRYTSVLLLAMTLDALASFETDVSSTSYGDLYISQATEKTKNHLDFAACYALGLGTPQYLLKGALLGAEYSGIFDNFIIGLEANFYKATDSALEEVLKKELYTLGTSIKYSHPKSSYYGKIGLSPLNGLINLFSIKVISYSLVIGAGGGYTRHSQNISGPGMKFFLEQKIQFSHKFGLMIGYSYYYEKLKQNAAPITSWVASWVGRSQVEAGAYVRF